MTEITHATFQIERVYDAAPARVFHVFTDPASRWRWFYKADSWTIHEKSGGELAVGATESSRFSPPGADVEVTSDSVYLEIVPNERLIFAFAMTLDGAALSSSLATAEFRAEGAGTRLVFTEQGAYHDGNVAGRKEGSLEMLESVAEELARAG